jgi:HSP20 family protein
MRPARDPRTITMPTLASDLPFRHLGRPGPKPDQLKGYYNFFGPETWTPSVNLYESESTYLVCVDLAGVDKDKIDIEVADNVLSLKGSRTVPTTIPNAEGAVAAATGETKLRVHLMEIDHGSFCRTVELPENVAREEITARYDAGILWIELPKK